MTKKFKILGILVLVGLFFFVQSIVLSSGGDAKKHEHDDHDHDEKQEDLLKLSNETKANIGLKVGVVEKKDYTKYLEVPIHISTAPESEFAFVLPTKCVISSLNISEGAYVQKGQQLVKLSRCVLPKPDMADLNDYFKNKNIDGCIRAVLMDDMDSIDYFMPYLNALKISKNDLLAQKSGGLIKLRQFFYLKIGKEYKLVSDKYFSHLEQLLKLDTDTTPDLIPLFVYLTNKQMLKDEHIDDLHIYAKNQSEVYSYLCYVFENKSLTQLKWLSRHGFLKDNILLSAPSNGYIKNVNFVAGEILSDGDLIFKFIGVDQFVGKVQLIGKEQNLAQLAINTNAEFNLRKKNSSEIYAIKFKGIESNDQHKTTYIFSILKNDKDDQGVFYPGETGVLMLPEKVLKNSLMVPIGALIEEGYRKYVFLENGSSFEKVEVAILYKDKSVAILNESGNVYEGDRVVTQGAIALDMIVKASERPADDGHHHNDH